MERVLTYSIHYASIDWIYKTKFINQACLGYNANENMTAYIWISQISKQTTAYLICARGKFTIICHAIICSIMCIPVLSM